MRAREMPGQNERTNERTARIKPLYRISLARMVSRRAAVSLALAPVRAWNGPRLPVFPADAGDAKLAMNIDNSAAARHRVPRHSDLVLWRLATTNSFRETLWSGSALYCAALPAPFTPKAVM